VKVLAVRDSFWDDYKVTFVFEGRRFNIAQLYMRKEKAQALADKLQAVFDKGQAGT